MELVQGTIVANRFQLVRELGHGGMGSVWLAHHTGLDTPCAVKFIHQDAAAHAEVRARFEREAKAAAQIRSSHVVQILDYGVWESVPYIAMEYLQGEDLASRIRRQNRLPAREVAHIVAQVARALSKAHQAGLVHRDLKPENIFLVREDDQEIAKVLDFGIAKSHEKFIQSDSNTKTGSLLGTPHYMSPEQAQGTKTVDHRTDLWALAVVAYRCLTGRLPFESDALGDLLLKIIVNPVPIPSQVCGDLPSTLDQWWMRATNRDTEQRFQSAKELSDSLSVALGLSHAAGAMSAPATAASPQLPGATGTTPMSHSPVLGSDPRGIPSASPSGPGYSGPGYGDARGGMASSSGAYPAQGGAPGYGGQSYGAAGVGGHTPNPAGTLGQGAHAYPQAPRKSGKGPLVAVAAIAVVLGLVGVISVASKGGNAKDDPTPASGREQSEADDDATAATVTATDEVVAAGDATTTQALGSAEAAGADSGAPTAGTEPAAPPSTNPPSKPPPATPPPTKPPPTRPPPATPPPTKPPPATPPPTKSPPPPGRDFGF